MARLRLPLFLCISLFSMTAVSHAAVLLDRVVAVVNQEVITWSELYKAMESDASPQVKALAEDEKRKIYKQNESSFLESLIDVRLQLQEARNVGIAVGEEELKDAIENIKKKYSMTDDMFKESLKKEGFTLDEYKQKLRDQITISKVVNQQVRSKILVTDEEVRKYIRDNAGKSDGYRISQIFLAKPQQPGDKKKVEERAAEILKKIREGEDFRELARTYSEDSSAKDGGDLGFIAKDQLMKEFAEALAPLKVGEVSTPFWTERGLHIIKLDERRDTKDQSEMKMEAERALTERIFSQRYHAWVKSLREKAFIEIRL